MDFIGTMNITQPIVEDNDLTPVLLTTGPVSLDGDPESLTFFHMGYPGIVNDVELEEPH